MQSKWLVSFFVVAMMVGSGCGRRCRRHEILQAGPMIAPISTISDTGSEDFYRQFLFQLARPCGTATVIYQFSESRNLKIAVNAQGQDVLTERPISMRKPHVDTSHVFSPSNNIDKAPSVEYMKFEQTQE